MGASRQSPPGSRGKIEDLLDAPTRSEQLSTDDAPTELSLELNRERMLRATMPPSPVDPFAETNKDGIDLAELMQAAEDTKDREVTARRLVAPSLPGSEPPHADRFEIMAADTLDESRTSPSVARSSLGTKRPGLGPRFKLIFALNVALLALALIAAAWILGSRDVDVEEASISSPR